MRVDTAGEITAELHLELTPGCITALEQMNIPVPSRVLLLLKEATGRERTRFNLEKEGIGKSDPEAWLIQLLMARAEEGTDERVVRELLNDCSQTFIAQYCYAYIHGAFLDPKKLLTVMQNAQATQSDLLLSALVSATPPSSPTTTASPKKTSRTTRPVT